MRPVTSAPEGRPGSALNTARAPRAAASITGRDAGEAISSSEVTRLTTARAAPPRRANASSTNAFITSPAFMSATPGPYARSPSTRNGRCAAVPRGNTVSRWPSSRTWALSRPGSPAGTVALIDTLPSAWTISAHAMPRACRCSRMSAPARATPSLSYEPESVSTSRPSSSTIASYWLSSQPIISSSRALSVMAPPRQMRRQ